MIKNTDMKDKIELIKDIKVYNPDNETEVEFSSLWKDMTGDNLIFIMFFRHWG